MHVTYDNCKKYNDSKLTLKILIQISSRYQTQGTLDSYITMIIILKYLVHNSLYKVNFKILDYYKRCMEIQAWLNANSPQSNQFFPENIFMNKFNKCSIQEIFQKHKKTNELLFKSSSII